MGSFPVSAISNRVHSVDFDRMLILHIAGHCACNNLVPSIKLGDHFHCAIANASTALFPETNPICERVVHIYVYVCT